jgi:hypothetical protein
MCSTGHNNVVVTSVHFWLNKLSSPAVCPILWSTYLALGPGLDTSLAARSKREQALRQTVESCQKLWEERTNRIWSTYIRQWSSNHTFHRSCLLPLFFPSSRSLHLSLNRCRSTYVYHNNAALIEWSVKDCFYPARAPWYGYRPRTAIMHGLYSSDHFLCV